MLPAFPKFAPLTLDDQETYDKFVSEFPPYSDISFTTLHIWWNLGGKLAASDLLGNLVLRYHLPFDRRNSGYSLIGTRQIDKSIELLFEQLRNKERPVKLVHVPEFVIREIKHPKRLQLTEEIDYNEYIFDNQALATLEGAEQGRTRREINRFFRGTAGRLVESRPLDLTSAQVRDDLFASIVRWEENHPARNNPRHTEYQAIQNTLAHAAVFDIQNLGIYIDGKLCAIVLYHKTKDKQYYIVHHIKVDYSVQDMFDYATHKIAQVAWEENVPYMNGEMDLGIKNLRQHKMRLRPVEFFRKYTITPAVAQQSLTPKPAKPHLSARGR